MDGEGGGEFDGMHGDVKTFQMKGASEELVSALAARLKGPRRLLSAGSGGWGDGVDGGGRGGGRGARAPRICLRLLNTSVDRDSNKRSRNNYKLTPALIVRKVKSLSAGCCLLERGEQQQQLREEHCSPISCSDTP